MLNTSKPSGQVVQRLKNHRKTVYLVNPRAPDASQHVYKSLSDIPDSNQIEVVDMIINPKTGVSVIEDAHSVGIKDFFLQPGADTPEVIEAVQKINGRYHQGCVLRELLPAEGPSSHSSL